MDANGRSKHAARSPTEGNRALEPSCAHAKHDDRFWCLWSAVFARRPSWEVEPTRVLFGSSRCGDCSRITGGGLVSVSSDRGTLPIRWSRFRAFCRNSGGLAHVALADRRVLCPGKSLRFIFTPILPRSRG